MLMKRVCSRRLFGCTCVQQEICTVGWCVRSFPDQILLCFLFRATSWEVAASPWPISSSPKTSSFLSAWGELHCVLYLSLQCCRFMVQTSFGVIRAHAMNSLEVDDVRLTQLIKQGWDSSRKQAICSCIWHIFSCHTAWSDCPINAQLEFLLYGRTGWVVDLCYYVTCKNME